MSSRQPTPNPHHVPEDDVVLIDADFRDHLKVMGEEVRDPDSLFDRDHSLWMEKQALALQAGRNLHLEIRCQPKEMFSPKTLLRRFPDLCLSLATECQTPYDKISISVTSQDYSTDQLWRILWFVRFLRCRSLLLNGLDQETQMKFATVMEAPHISELPRLAREFKSWLSNFTYSLTFKARQLDESPFDFQALKIDAEQCECDLDDDEEEECPCFLRSIRLKMHRALREQETLTFFDCAKRYRTGIMERMNTSWPVIKPT